MSLSHDDISALIADEDSPPAAEIFEALFSALDPEKWAGAASGSQDGSQRDQDEEMAQGEPQPPAGELAFASPPLPVRLALTFTLARL